MNKASREHVHGSTFDVRSLILHLFGEGFDKDFGIEGYFQPKSYGLCFPISSMSG